jgi:hypothetical protein
MPELTVIAVDWSGAKQQNLSCGIWLTAIRSGRIVHSQAAASRDEAVAYVVECPPPVVAGLDFSFGVPEWFAREHACAAIADVWALAERDGERWLAPTAPFWRDAGCAPLRERRFRACEEALRARGYQPKSIFQLVGNGQVGAGSVRGMPLLARLRAAGFAIWPFDQAADRTVVEIYPSMLRKLVRHDDTDFANEHERDAVLSAAAMWEHRASFASRARTTDPVALIEGEVWHPDATARVSDATS